MWPRTMLHSSEADVVCFQRIEKLRVVNAGMFAILALADRLGNCLLIVDPREFPLIHWGTRVGYRNS